MWRRRLLMTAFVGVLVSPALRDRDGFPLSTQPMYATDRGRVSTFATVIGRRADRSPVRLPMRVIAATDDPLIAQTSVANAIASGRAEQWCEAVAVRVRDRTVVSVEVVRERVDALDMARGRVAFGSIEGAASCPVGAGPNVPPDPAT